MPPPERQVHSEAAPRTLAAVPGIDLFNKGHPEISIIFTARSLP
ncbi:MAG: hypothetical protein JWM91_781, partial [Rhodospirillales bacterium]|nr:hypothetical protein [Rhodospirillales bacterium]